MPIIAPIHTEGNMKELANTFIHSPFGVFVIVMAIAAIVIPKVVKMWNAQDGTVIYDGETGRRL